MVDFMPKAKSTQEKSTITQREAEAYLERKGKIHGMVTYSKEEQKKVKEIMKKGKIYGDPLVELEETK